MIFFESIAARRFISLKMICFQLVFPPLKCVPFPSEQFPQKNALPVGSFSSNECATSRIMLFKRMRCPSDQFPAKNSLPVGSFSSKEYAARPINLLNRMRCRYAVVTLPTDPHFPNLVVAVSDDLQIRTLNEDILVNQIPILYYTARLVSGLQTST